MPQGIVGRLAPSPTGAQHLGNARTFLIAWILARRDGGQLWLRIEDLETPRVKEGATQQAIEDLRWMGIDWDPYVGSSLIPPSTMVVQSTRIARYLGILNQLKERELVYPCTCTRREVETLAGAPHEANLRDPVYPGSCAHRKATDHLELDAEDIAYAWRFRMPAASLGFVDRFQGMVDWPSPHRTLGDFVVARVNGQIAYQLAVVVDDHDMQVTQVVRGDDLVLSTCRQLALYAALGWQPPEFCHLPLVVGPDLRRLAKRHGDTRLATLREAGIHSQTVLGFLAYHSRILDSCEPVDARSLLHCDPLARLPRTPLVFGASDAVAYFKDLESTSRG